MQSLIRDPEIGAVDLPELVGIAHAIELTAVERYRWLAEEMARRGEMETAEVFRKLEVEERHHIATVGDWAKALGENVPEASFDWRLPPEVAQSWEEAATSVLLTPYRALAIAVDNEQRAFSFYAYIAARTRDAAVAREAEALAQQELNHAALLRTWRRIAWRRERKDSGAWPSRRIETSADLAVLIEAQQAEIQRRHEHLAGRLRALGDTASAALLDEAAGPSAPSPDAGETGGDGSNDSIRRLLAEAQKPLERFSEILEAVLAAPPDAAMQNQAHEALESVIARIARIDRRSETLTPS
jgi:rubrerythrin